jgi:putative PEP-CTERM system histidine kinase
MDGLAALTLAGFILQLAGAAACLVAAGWLLRKGDRHRAERRGMIAALCLTALWGVTVAASGAGSATAGLASTLRDFAWIFVLYRLFANDGRDRSQKPIRAVVAALAFVVSMGPALLIVALRFAVTPGLRELTFEVGSLFRVLTAVGALVLLHNLYAGADNAWRQTLRWTAAGLALMWAFQLHYNTVGYLSGSVSPGLSAVRGLVIALSAVLVAVGGNAGAAELRFRPSRAVAFQSLSLLLIGGYLVGMLGIAWSLSLFGDGLGRLTQVGFVLGAIVVALLWLPSPRLRGWLRVTATKHLFQHRYDYRAEWLRFTRTIGRASGGGTLHERAVQALAEITDSPGGVLFLPGEDAMLELAERWQWPELELAARPFPPEFSATLERTGAIVELDQIRDGGSLMGEAIELPDWLAGEPRAWAIVPLIHFDRLTGVVVLARPAVQRRLDWEDFDLLKVVGQQLASYLAEQVGQAALLEANRFDEFNRRMAFVMHDIKNLASQLSLLSRNAQRHADNPEFRKDMLVTLTNSAEKLNALLKRLGRYGAGGGAGRKPVDLVRLAAGIAERLAAVHPVQLARADDCRVLADAEGLEQALVHLVQNAIDASAPESPVYLDVSCDGIQGRVEVVDAGSGMSPHFMRESLFKPFVSSKDGGFGIGAFEARELVRAMGGRLDVESREGLGTRFSILLPLSAAAGFLGRDQSIEEAAA